MIILKMTSELLIDLFTPEQIGPIKCVAGLPEKITLISVSLDITGVITYKFDDGKDEVTTLFVKFERV